MPICTLAGSSIRISSILGSAQTWTSAELPWNWLGRTATDFALSRERNFGLRSWRMPTSTEQLPDSPSARITTVDAVPPGLRRGEGEAMAGVVFRDPVGFDAKVAALRLEIAHTLVRAPRLPIELRVFDLTLLSVESDRNSIDLLIGKTQPIARLRLKRAPLGAGADSPARHPVVDIEIVPVHSDVQRFQRQLQEMAQRLRAAITDEKWKRALQQAKQLAELPVGVPLAFYRQLVPGTDEQALVRTGFNCNQNCGICWQDREWGKFGPEQTLIWIEDLYAAGARRLIISGGEPTLDYRLESYIRRARELGFYSVTLETNAIQFSKGGLAERLRDAGLDDCFVSLHSGDAATSDAITRAPGTFTRTVAGIRALLAAQVPVRLNCVMTREGIDHLEGVPDFIHQALGAHPALQGVMLSQPTDPYDRSLLPSISPEPDRLRAVLRKVIDRAFALGIRISGLDGQCGPPLCSFGADRRITALTPIRERLDGRAYLPACEGCAVRSACYGVRIADVNLYGDACALPFTSVPSS
jgi:pyruvate-formate lyase-activating enzyme